MEILIPIALLAIYILIAWALKRVIWNPASEITNPAKRILIKSFFVALVATPTLTPTIPFQFPMPALVMLLTGTITPFFTGFDYWRYDLLVRAGMTGLVPILAGTVLVFVVSMVVFKLRQPS